MDISKLREKAASGNVVAQVVVGVCYLNGIDTEVNYEEAFEYLSSAADRGSARAMLNLAKMYAQGLGIPNDEAKAVSLYEEAAKAGEFLAQVELGRRSAHGSGMPLDPLTARKWYGLALAQEHQVNSWAEIEEARSYLARKE